MVPPTRRAKSRPRWPWKENPDESSPRRGPARRDLPPGPVPPHRRRPRRRENRGAGAAGGPPARRAPAERDRGAHVHALDGRGPPPAHRRSPAPGPAVPGLRGGRPVRPRARWRHRLRLRRLRRPGSPVRRRRGDRHPARPGREVGAARAQGRARRRRGGQGPGPRPRPHLRAGHARGRGRPDRPRPGGRREEEDHPEGAQGRASARGPRPRRMADAHRGPAAAPRSQPRHLRRPAGDAPGRRRDARGRPG